MLSVAQILRNHQPPNGKSGFRCDSARGYLLGAHFQRKKQASTGFRSVLRNFQAQRRFTAAWTCSEDVQALIEQSAAEPLVKAGVACADCDFLPGFQLRTIVEKRHQRI